MRITFDPVKRDKTLAERGLDFQDAAVVFAGTTVEVIDGARTMVNAASSATAFCTAESSWWATPRVARPATSSACERPTIVSKPASRRTSGSDLKRVDAHVIKPHEYKELPELTSAMLARAVVNKGGRPKSPNPRQLISLRLPPEVIERWRATGPGWQTRMAEQLAKGPRVRARSAT